MTPTTIKSHPSEKTILGNILREGDGNYLATLDLDPSHFLDHKHSELMKLLKRRYRAGKTLDMASVCAELLTVENMDLYGGITYVSSLPEFADSGLDMDKHLLQVRRRKDRFNLHRKLSRTAEKLLTKETDALTAATSLIPSLMKVNDHSLKTKGQVIESLKDSLFDEAVGNVDRYMRTGIPGWDNHQDFAGLSTQGVTLILAASGMGKTTLLNRLAIGLLSEGKKVHLVGTETTSTRRLQDLAFSLAKVDQRKWARLTRTIKELKDRAETDEFIAKEIAVQRMKLDLALDWLHDQPLHITGSGSTVEDIISTTHRLKERGAVDVVLVDYLQDITDSSGLGVRLGDRVQQVGHKSQQLKHLAASLNLPVVVGAQVSNEKMGRNMDPRPAMHSCQWSSSAHQDAECVYALYRDDYYADRYPDWTPIGEAGVVEVITRKQRVGRMATLSLSFDGPTRWIGGDIKGYAL